MAARIRKLLNYGAKQREHISSPHNTPRTYRKKKVQLTLTPEDKVEGLKSVYKRDEGYYFLIVHKNKYFPIGPEETPLKVALKAREALKKLKPTARVLSIESYKKATLRILAEQKGILSLS